MKYHLYKKKSINEIKKEVILKMQNSQLKEILVPTKIPSIYIS